MDLPVRVNHNGLGQGEHCKQRGESDAQLCPTRHIEDVRPVGSQGLSQRPEQSWGSCDLLSSPDLSGLTEELGGNTVLVQAL